jgi:hypothetical protein
VTRRALGALLATAITGTGCLLEPGAPAPVTWLDRGSGPESGAAAMPLTPGLRLFEDGRVGGEFVAFLGPEAREGAGLTEIQTADGLLWMSRGAEGTLLHGGFRDGLLASGARLVLPEPLRVGMSWRVPSDAGEMTYAVRARATEATVWGTRDVWTVRQELRIDDGLLVNERRYAEAVGLLDIVDEDGTTLVAYGAGLVPLERPADWTDGPTPTPLALEPIPFARELRVALEPDRSLSLTHYPPPWSASAIDFGDGWPVVAINRADDEEGRQLACVKAGTILREMPTGVTDQEGCPSHSYSDGDLGSEVINVFLRFTGAMTFAAERGPAIDAGEAPSPDGSLIGTSNGFDARISTGLRIRRTDGARLELIPAVDGGWGADRTSNDLGARLIVRDAAGALVETRLIESDWFDVDALGADATQRDGWTSRGLGYSARLVRTRVFAPPTWDGSSPLPIVLVGAQGTVALSRFDGERLSAPEVLFEVGPARLTTQLFRDRRETLFVHEGGAVDRLVLEPEPGLERVAVLDVPDREQLRAAFTTDGGTRLLAITVAPNPEADRAPWRGHPDRVRFYGARLEAAPIPGTPRRGTALIYADLGGDVLVCSAPAAGELPREGWQLGGSAAGFAADRATGCGVVIRAATLDTCAPDALTAEHAALPSLGHALLRPTASWNGNYPQYETSIASQEAQATIAPVSGGGFVTVTHRYGAGGFRLGWTQAGRDAPDGQHWVADEGGHGIWIGGRGGGAFPYPYLRLDGRDSSTSFELPAELSVQDLLPVGGGGVLVRMFPPGSSPVPRYWLASPDGSLSEITARLDAAELSPEAITEDGTICGAFDRSPWAYGCLAPGGAVTELAAAPRELRDAVATGAFHAGWLPLGERWIVASRAGGGTVVLDAASGEITAEDPRHLLDARHDARGRLFGVAEGEPPVVVEVTPEGLLEVPMTLRLIGREDCRSSDTQPVRVIPDEDAFVVVVEGELLVRVPRES